MRSPAVSASVPSRSNTSVRTGFIVFQSSFQKSGSAGASRPAYPQRGDLLARARPRRSRPRRRRASPRPARARGGRRDLADEAPQRLVLVHADHRIVVAGHADVGDEARAAAQDARVGGGRVRMGADAKADAAVDEIARTPVSRWSPRRGNRRSPRRIRRPTGRPSIRASIRGERIVERIHEHPAHHIDDQHLRAVGRFDQVRAAARRAGGIVGGPDQARLALDEDQRLASDRRRDCRA